MQGFPSYRVGFLNKGPVMREAFSCHDVAWWHWSLTLGSLSAQSRSVASDPSSQWYPLPSGFGRRPIQTRSDLGNIKDNGGVKCRVEWHVTNKTITMDTIASQIISLTIVYSTVCSDANQRKHPSSASLAFVRGIHRGPVNSPHKWPVTRKRFSIWWRHHDVARHLLTLQ